MDTDFRKKMEERNERFEQLYNKPVNELVRMIVSLEEENERLKDYRTKLIKIRNIITPEEVQAALDTFFGNKKKN